MSTEDGKQANFEEKPQQLFPKKKITRNEFLKLVSIGGVFLATEGLRGISPEKFSSFIRKYAEETNKRPHTALSGVEPDENGMVLDKEEINGVVLSQNVFQARPNKSQLSISPLVPDFELKHLVYKKKQASSSNILDLWLGEHGDSPSTVRPIEIPNSPFFRHISIDSLQNVILISNPKVKEIVDKKIREGTNVGEQMIQISLPTDDIDDEQLFRSVNNFVFPWLHLPSHVIEEGKLKIVSTDALSNGMDMLERIFSYDEDVNVENLYKQFNQALDTSNWTLAAVLLNKVVNVFNKNEKMSRRQFFRNAGKIGKRGAALALGGSIAYLGLQSEEVVRKFYGDVKNITKIVRENPLPADESPKGYRGIIESLLALDPSEISLFGQSLLLRDLISSYKSTCLQKLIPDGQTQYLAWGAIHRNQEGLVDLSPKQILNYLQIFQQKHWVSIKDAYYAPTKVLYNKREVQVPNNSYYSLFTGTEYELRVVQNGRSSSTSNKFELSLNSATQFVFPELYKLFSN